MAIRLKFLHKLLILTVTPVLIAQFGTMVAVLQTSTKEIEAGAKQALKVGSAVAEQLMDARNRQISQNVRILASDFALKEVIAISDPESTRSALGNHARRIGADVSTFVSIDDVEPEGQFASAIERRINQYVRAALEGDEPIPEQFLITLNASLYQVFVAEMRAPVPIGYLMFGFRLGENTVKPIRELTGLNIAILDRGNSATASAVSIFVDHYSHLDTSDLLDSTRPENSVYPATAGGDDFWAIHMPLTHSGERVLIVLASERRNSIRQFLQQNNNLLFFGLSLLILVVALGAWLSAGVSRPIQKLVKATSSLADGRYDSEILVTSTDEIGDLASGFEEMRKAVASRELQISHQLMHDQLTGLPNQKQVIQRLNAGIIHGSFESISLIVFKLRNMHHIGSSLGLHATEQLILEAAKTIRTEAGSTNLAARIDNDRFAIVCYDTDSQSVQDVAIRVMDKLDHGTTLGATNIALKTNAGVAHFPLHTAASEDLIRYAMIASVDAAENKKRVETYDAGREADFTRYLKIVQDLPRAVEQDELIVFFQPKIAVQSGELYGAEALVRWVHPDLGFLPPDDFISAAERSDNIKLLTRYVLGKSIQAARGWQDQGYRLKVAVNLSALDLLDHGLFEFVLATLDEHDLAPEQLILEITESSVMEELDLAINTLTTFRAAGIKVSIDDFGTGHSSLAQLRDLPLDELKIDKSFVSDIATDQTSELLVSTTIKLAHGMGLTVVAEGVEDEFSLRRLHHHGCEVVQGYFFSKPLAESDFTQWMQEYKPEDLSERRADDRPFQAQTVLDQQNPTNRQMLRSGSNSGR